MCVITHRDHCMHCRVDSHTHTHSPSVRVHGKGSACTEEPVRAAAAAPAESNGTSGTGTMGSAGQRADTGVSALLSELLRIAQDATDAGSAPVPPVPTVQSSAPPLLRMEPNGTRCAEQILSYGRAEQVVIGGALTLLTLATVCGNLLVVISVCLVKKLRQPGNYLIVSLAVADLSVALAVMPFVSVTDLIGGQWIFGQFFCNVFIAMDVTCCTASILTLCVISVDRYLGITKPLTYPLRQSGGRMAKMIVWVWLLAASVTLPPLFGWAKNVNDGRVCLISQDLGYTVYSTAVAFYVPMTVMLVMYWRIYRAAKLSAAKHSITGFPRDAQPGGAGVELAVLPSPESGETASVDGMEVEQVLETMEHSITGGVETCGHLEVLPSAESGELTIVDEVLKTDKHHQNQTPTQRRRRKNQSIFRREQKAASTLGIVVGAFTVCWLPFFLASTARPFVCGVACSCVPLWLERTLLWLGYANSLINPFIYAFFNRDLRATYGHLLRCRYRNINRKLSAAGVHEALKLVERPGGGEGGHAHLH